MKYILIIIFVLNLVSCTSVEKYNTKRTALVSPEKLRKDVDFTYHKLKEMHPKLYWYISKNKLDFKFDSLKNTISQPLTPIEFYFKLQPVIAEIREGHLSLGIPMKRFSKKEIKALKNKKGLFGRFEYTVENDRLYITENKDSIDHIQPGTEILSINDIAVSDYMKKYRPLISSDGYNTTFHNYYMKDVFFNFYVAEKGIMDCAKVETFFNNERKTIYLTRASKSKEELEKEKNEKKRTDEKKVNDYVAFSDSYNRNFRFLDQDSTIAYMKIQSFSKRFSDRFYKESFQKLKRAASSYLILDIRNNYGGSLYEINNLYSYLAPEPFILIKPAQLASTATPLKTNYFRKSNALQSITKTLLYPGYFFSQIFSIYKGKDGIAYYKMKESKSTKPKNNAFKGKVYALINGGSFSASSVISSKLKYDKRVTLVGEETGGANDGTVAGFYSYQKLPNTGIELPIGLLLIQPNIDFTNTQKGVVPDIEITQNMQDILDKRDVQLDWIRKDIEKSKENTKTTD